MRSGEVMVVRDGVVADMMEVFHGVMKRRVSGAGLAAVR